MHYAHCRGDLYQPAERLTLRSPFPVMPTKSLPRAKAGIGIHDFPLMHAAKSWMPAAAGMTMWAPFMCQPFGRLVVRRETDKE